MAYYFLYLNSHINKFIAVRYETFYEAFRARQQWMTDKTAKDFDETASIMEKDFDIHFKNSHDAYEIWDNLQLHNARKCCIVDEAKYAEIKADKIAKNDYIKIPTKLYESL